MLISEFIKLLEDAKEKFGDVEVFSWPHDGQENVFTPVVEKGINCIFIEGD
jgi:hypothetical protein